MRIRFMPLVLYVIAMAAIALVPVALTGCSTNSATPPTAPAITALDVLQEVQSDVQALQTAEIAAYKAGLIDVATHIKIQVAIKLEATDASAVSEAIATAATPATVQAKVDALIADLQKDVTDGALGIKDAKTQAIVTASISAAEIAANGIIGAYQNGGK